ncbi:MAG TPA: M56 family metallopeptidase [Hanamia sp.]|nr:M56 family metallopeptidase [Hanamia sp.]
MITLAWYLLKVIICSGILCGYYFLALRNKAFHRWNRFYILAAIVISLLIPIMKINIFQNGEDKGTVVQMLQTISYGDEAVIEYSRNSGFQLTTQDLTEGAYLLISAVFLFIFFLSLYKIVRLKKKYPETKIEDISFINTDVKGTPFSFLKSIFWNNKIDLHSKQGQQIFNHEIAHIKEKHSYDKIFMNIVLIFFWINPFFWLMRKELYMIHEFIADKEALEDSDINAFAEMILQTVYPGQNFSFANNFFYSPIKRRIMMLAKNKNPKVNYISRLLVLPLAVIVLFAFTFRVKPVKKDFPQSLQRVIKNQISNTLPATELKNDTISDGTLIVADGKEISKDEMKSIPSSNIQSINVLKGKIAIKKYGAKGKDGVIEITTKNKNIYATKNDSSNFVKISKGTLFFVEGKEVSQDKMKNIPQYNIQSINVLKGDSAEKKYGVKGRNGVIEIITKKTGEEINHTQTYLPESQKDSIPRIVFTKVENEASFPGGLAAWQKYIVKKIQSSLDSFTEADYGTCVLKFIVNTDGSVTNVEATTMKGTHLAKVSINSIKNGPKWIPASQNGHTVASYRLQPVTLTNPEDSQKNSTKS